MKAIFVLVILAIFTQALSSRQRIIDRPRNKLRSFSVFQPKQIVELVRAYDLLELVKHEVEKQQEIENNQKLEENRQKEIRENVKWRGWRK